MELTRKHGPGSHGRELHASGNREVFGITLNDLLGKLNSLIRWIRRLTL